MGCRPAFGAQHSMASTGASRQVYRVSAGEAKVMVVHFCGKASVPDRALKAEG